MMNITQDEIWEAARLSKTVRLVRNNDWWYELGKIHGKKQATGVTIATMEGAYTIGFKEGRLQQMLEGEKDVGQ